MSKEFSFSVMPSVSISRSRFARKSQHKTSFDMGYLIPIYCDEVLPGDTRSIDMASLVRMSTPIAPIMDNIYLDLYAFFVPNRLVWVHWKEFMGENNTSAGIPLVSYAVPKVRATAFSTTPDKDSLWSYFGLPAIQGVAPKVSALPFRGYALIYNEWFRNQNVIAPLPVETGDTDRVLVSASQDFTILHSNLPKAAKLADYFTASLPYAQKGAAVTIPLGTTAPVGYINSGTAAIIPGSLTSITQHGGNVGDFVPVATPDTSGPNRPDMRFVADLRNATAASINQLRYAFQLQKLLEKDALYGTRYWEILAAHFGIHAPDASLQRPEFLGGHRIRINVDQVLTTAGYDDSSSQEVGKPGANSVTGSKVSLFTKSFTEHGYIFIIAVARHDQTYAQGINRMWLRSNRFDYYWPVFANLGAQDVKNIEIYAQGTSADDSIFGYQEAWSEYRYKPSIATGLLNPNVANSLDYWTLTNAFSSLPTLGQTFMEQDRENIKRALTTGNTGPDFIGDFYFMDVAVRPMPMYSIPGLIDHH